MFVTWMENKQELCFVVRCSGNYVWQGCLASAQLSKIFEPSLCWAGWQLLSDKPLRWDFPILSFYSGIFLWETVLTGIKNKLINKRIWSAVTRPGCKSWFYHFVATWHWTSQLYSSQWSRAILFSKLFSMIAMWLLSIWNLPTVTEFFMLLSPAL